MLALSGAVWAVVGTLYLPFYLGVVPIPVAAVVAGLGVAANSVFSQRLGGGSSGALPVLAFLLTVAVFLMGGPSESVVYNDWKIAVLLGCGVGFPVLAWYLRLAERLDL